MQDSYQDAVSHYDCRGSHEPNVNFCRLQTPSKDITRSIRFSTLHCGPEVVKSSETGYSHSEVPRIYHNKDLWSALSRNALLRDSLFQSPGLGNIMQLSKLSGEPLFDLCHLLYWSCPDCLIRSIFCLASTYLLFHSIIQPEIHHEPHISQAHLIFLHVLASETMPGQTTQPPSSNSNATSKNSPVNLCLYVLTSIGASNKENNSASSSSKEGTTHSTTKSAWLSPSGPCYLPAHLRHV